MEDPKGDIIIRDLCTQEKDSIYNMRVVNTDTTSYQAKTPDKFLETAEKEKNMKYLDACISQRWHFIPFVYSVDIKYQHNYIP